MNKINCGNVWIGNKNADFPFETKGVTGHIYSQSSEGDRGGDIYYVSVCDGDIMTRILIGDVAGHGDSISNISENIYQTLVQMKNNFSNSEFLKELNRILTFKSETKNTTTIALVSFYRSDKTFSFSYAGHPPLYFIQKKKLEGWRKASFSHRKQFGDLPVGIMQNIEYTEERIQLEPGDRLFIYSDGVTETPKNKDYSQMYQDENLEHFLNLNKNKELAVIKELLINDLNVFSGQKLNHDDITFIQIEVKPDSET